MWTSLGCLVSVGLRKADSARESRPVEQLRYDGETLRWKKENSARPVFSSGLGVIVIHGSPLIGTLLQGWPDVFSFWQR